MVAVVVANQMTPKTLLDVTAALAQSVLFGEEAVHSHQQIQEIYRYGTFY
jgi:hypothetical protein